MNCINNESLFIKKMIYRRYGEIIISEYISREFDDSTAAAPFNKFIKGLTEEDIYGPENQLDMYYLNYEKKLKPYSFMYN